MRRSFLQFAIIQGLFYIWEKLRIEHTLHQAELCSTFAYGSNGAIGYILGADINISIKIVFRITSIHVSQDIYLY